jgi:class 3 adenylate cyclase/tetratricopeptide (TPR) repeat protein
MICPECQFENREGAKFCNECGHTFEIKCPECGTNNRPGSKFCDECGYDLKEPKETPPIDYSKPQSYTPKHLKDKILTTRSSIEGERKLVTVFFADIANYTSMSEKLDPEEVHQIMDGCFKILMDEIHKYEGTINQFTGDGVMALFGAPVAHEDHAQRACYAALSVQKAMEAYGEKISKDTGFDFKMRIGLNSGHVIVSSIGDDLRMDYTAVGDTTNLASRMESAAKPGSVLLSENSYKIAQRYFEFEPKSKIEVKGKEKPQGAYELIKPSDVETRIEASISKGLTKFVGRKNSLPALIEVWDKARSGSGQVVGFVGEAGVGKSRLLLEFINKLPQGEFTYLEGRCLQYGENIIYMPILDIVKWYFDIQEGDREFIIKKKILAKTFDIDEVFSESSLPVFQDFLYLQVDDEDFTKLEPQQKREKTFETIRDLFIRESQKRPLILAIEDLHWIDRTSEEFIHYLIEWLANARIMLILLYRTEYRHQWGSKTYYSKIGVDQLGAESSVELVKVMLEGGEVVPELRELILSRSAGNPLFMEEFTHSLLENGAIAKQDNRFVLSRDVSDIDVPDTIQGIIAARMDRLEENLKRTMQVASVIGRDFAFRILQTIVDMKEDLKANLLNLQGLEFIYEKSLFPELEYIFKHALTQEVAYNSLLQKRRKEIHENIGKAIEEIYAERLEEFYEMLAYHYSRSDRLEKACRYSRLSGEKAYGNYSHWEAYGFYKDAVALLNRLPETEDNKREKIEVLYMMRSPMALLGYPEDSLGMLQEGERLSKELGDERHLAWFYSVMSNYYSFKGNPQLGMKYSEDAFEGARKNQDIDLVAPLGFSLSVSCIATGEYYKIVDMAPDIIDLIEKTERKSDFFSLAMNPYSILCAFYGYSMGLLGDFEEGENFIEKGLGNVSDINDLQTLGMVEMVYGLFFNARGDWERTIEHFKKCIKYSEEGKWDYGCAISWSGSGYAYSMLGDPEIGRRHAEKGLKMHRDIGIEMLFSLGNWLLSSIHLDLGDLKKARSLSEEALRLSQKNNEKVLEGWSWLLLGRILGKTEPSQIDKAEECILKGIEILEILKIKASYSLGYLYLGELYLNAREKEKAKNNLKKAEGMFQEMGMDYWLAITSAVYADLYRKEGDHSKAKENLNKAIEILKECGADGWVEKYEKELAAIS